VSALATTKAQSGDNGSLRYARLTSTVNSLTSRLQTSEAKGGRLNEENQAEPPQEPCSGCIVEERLSALEEIIEESQQLLKALRREARQIRTLLDKEK
jgi:hypothetical protein